MLMFGSTCFGHNYAHRLELTTTKKKSHHTTNTKTYTNATSYIFTEPDGLWVTNAIVVSSWRWA